MPPGNDRWSSGLRPDGTRLGAAGVASRRLIERGTFTPPAHEFAGARYKSASRSPKEEEWENIRQLWQQQGRD